MSELQGFLERHKGRAGDGLLGETILRFLAQRRQRNGHSEPYSEPTDKELVKACIRLRGLLYLKALEFGLPERSPH